MIPLFKVGMNPVARISVDTVLNSGFIGQGEYVEKFEKALEDILPYKNIIATNSCTSAIELVLRQLEIGPGDEVITTPMTCVATNAPIVHLGARPVWADVNPFTGNIDPVSIAAKITPRTRAIIAVDWTGRRADYAKIRELTGGVFPIIQDAAHGPIFRDPGQELLPACGDFICSSYGPIKHLTCGDGGSIASPFTVDQEEFRLLRWYGLDRRSLKDFRCEQNIVKAGMKWHMNDINAAIGLANLQDLRHRVKRHLDNARNLWFQLSVARTHPVRLPKFDNQSNYWVFPILVSDGHRDSLKTYLNDHGIMASEVHKRNDLHTAYDYPSGDLYGLNSFAERQLNIPCGWWLSQEDINKIVSTIVGWKP